jgi:hypothetical protein
MFDQFAQQLIDQLPQLGDLNKEACRRALSSAYIQLLRTQLGLNQGSDATTSAETKTTLRKMADALESVSVFDGLNGVPLDGTTESACAFVAAEAVFFLHEIESNVPLVSDEVRRVYGSIPKDPLFEATNYLKVESALLYMIGGYDVNAGTLAERLPPFTSSASNSLSGALADNSSYLLSRIKAFCVGAVSEPSQSVPFVGMDIPPTLYEDLVNETRIWLYWTIANSLNKYLDWLGGYPDGSLEEALQALRRTRLSLLPTNEVQLAPFSDVYHLTSLIIAAIDRTSKRSVFHGTPRPSSEMGFAAQYQEYLLTRVRGTENQGGRPYLWPSSAEFVAQCLPGPKCDSVISMPTGSGKSFVAELAIVDALARGNVIYLAPTNALVHQIRRDLSKALKAFKGIQISAFVGGGEYTNLLESTLDETGNRFVAVMTPEKCALALRLSPRSFAGIALCVFDECHLINDSKRGVISDILIANLFSACPNIHFLLMSAMLSNADELAQWLASSRNSDAIPSVTKWRPSRTLRGLVFLNKQQTDDAFAKASGDLAFIRIKQPSRRANGFDAQLGLVANLSGAWTRDGAPDYAAISLDAHVPAFARWNTPTDKALADYAGWKNKAARTLAEQFSKVGISTIAFVLSSRHHAFSLARDVTDEIPGRIGDGALPPIVNAWLGISEMELGGVSVLGALLRRGISVHTSAMLQTEQAASEWMFGKQYAKLMFATPTLAQGLNLPAIAVVVAGTTMGNPMDAQNADQVAGLSGRVESLILNGFGRAGRPGFSNQGVGILVSDNPYFGNVVGPINGSNVTAKYPVLTQADASVTVRSPIESFLDRMIANVDAYNHNSANEVELELTTLLGESTTEENNAGHILKRTFAGYRLRNSFTDEIAVRVNDRIAMLKKEFLEQDDIPNWINTAAMKAGVTIFRASKMWAAYLGRGEVSLEEGRSYGVEDWLKVFIEIMAELPPRRVQRYMAEGNVKTVTFMTKLRDAAGTNAELDESPWDKPETWEGIWTELRDVLWAYMNGASFNDLGAKYYNLPAAEIGNERTSGTIPGVFALIQKVFEQLAIDAGCFVALTECHWQQSSGDELTLPQTLQALPLCIRAGADSISVLGWYRFGYRQRICAHGLSKAFPVPVDMGTDDDVANWIKATRRNWLRNGLEEESELLAHVRTILTEAND